MQAMVRISMALILGAGLTAMGCGSQVTKKEARQGWAATSSALTAGQVQATSSGTGDVNVDYSCPEGGTGHFDGTWDSGTETFAFTVSFDQCSSQGVEINGDLDFEMDADTSSSGASVTYTYQGTLEWSGDVNGSCDIDMTGSASATTSGASVSYSGSVCGHDASASLSAGS